MQLICSKDMQVVDIDDQIGYGANGLRFIDTSLFQHLQGLLSQFWAGK